MTSNWHCRTIICIDDEESVLDSYRQVLAVSDEDNELADILSLADERAGEEEVAAVGDAQPEYNLLFADSGQRAVELVRAEMAAGRRVAAGFFDMRMPVMDGYETIKALLELDPDLICTVVTAYTDRSVTQIRDLFSGHHQDQLLYFKKPFAPEELTQSALNMVSAWNNKRQVEEYMRAIEKHKHGLSHILHAVGILSCVPPQSLQSILTGLLFQFMAFLEAEHGYAVFWPEQDGPKLQYGVGRFDGVEDLHELVGQDPRFQKSLDRNRCVMADKICFVPLVNQVQQFGAIYIEAKHPIESRIDISLIEIFKTQMVQLILNSLYHQQALMSEEESVTDPLTGLYNRRFLMKVWHDELRRSTSTRVQLAVVMIDLDDFKKVNDTYGHDAGDAALRKVGNVLRLAVRTCDILGLGRDMEKIGHTEQYALRMGGEEFCAILLNTDEEAAARVGERIRASIAQGGFPYKGQELPIFASLGIWCGEVNLLELTDDTLLEGFIGYADKALYRAKKTGKNQVVFYQEGMNWE